MALITYGATTTGSLSDVVSAYGGELMIVLYTLVEMQIMDRRITGSALTGKGGIRMLDREKVIGLLQEAAEYFRGCRANASFGSKAENHFWELQNAANEAAALLKEQQQLIDEITQRRANNGAFD